MVIGCDRVDRRKSGGDGSQVAAEPGYHARLGKLEERGSAIAEMGSRLGDKVEGTVTPSSCPLSSSLVDYSRIRNGSHLLTCTPGFLFQFHTFGEDF